LLAAGAGTGHGPRDRAAAFLEKYLAAGPRTAADIWEAAQATALTHTTLYRAGKGLGITFYRITQAGRAVTYWLLPGQELPEGVSAPARACPVASGSALWPTPAVFGSSQAQVT